MSLTKRPEVTLKRLAANRANSKKSTGPRTGWGKYFTAMNGWSGGRPPVPGTPRFQRRCIALAEQLGIGLDRLEQLRTEMPHGFQKLWRLRHNRMLEYINRKLKEEPDAKRKRAIAAQIQMRTAALRREPASTAGGRAPVIAGE